MKRPVSLALALVLGVGLFGCSGGQQASAPPAESTAPSSAPSAAPSSAPESAPPAQTGSLSDWKVATLVPGSPTDGGFCQLGAEATQAVANQLGCEITIIEAATADKMKSEAETLAEEGYNIIFGHGGQYASPFAEISGEYPDTWFITLGGTDVTDNQFPVNITFEESTYVAGVVAGKMSQSGKLGLMVGGDFPSYTKTTRAMELGAKSVNPDIETMFAVLTNIDMNEAYETTMNQINSGADIIFSNSNEGSLGSIKAAVDKNIYCIGALADYSGEAPDNCMISCICDYNMAYVSAVKAVAEGTYEGGIMFTGMADGAVRFVWNENLKSQIPQEVIDLADETAQKIASGEIDVPNEYE
ncbi:BMP family ABC transporter substrate-binding protein [Pseudoflavonifractor sp. 524-17]|uniref:BMP family protein n=1 Tax=Pseudoflavonifractor sp. 524-17 TaxID=2304577 RepID=UPI001379BF8A|nr:BMP family protein [Pseudoflavonifractor sp. 524-17]NCE65017.1 BMP family ABC transporter substrate-binding protein [Pseudoflavonifractor sp. 524-17]